MKKTLTIIDTFGFLFRSYYALPPLRSKTGFPTGMLTGFLNLIANIGKDFQTDYLVFALDSKGDTFRNKIYPQYKAHRPDVPEDLLAQLPVAIEFIEKMGFAKAIKSGYEADDMIASLATLATEQNLEVRIVSHDKDLYQLIDENIKMFDPLKKKTITRDECYDKYGVYPEQFIDYQSLLGDSADNVPGVKGVGAKTAQALISQFNTLENIYENIDKIEKPRWQKLLLEGKEMAFISKQLVTLHKDAHILEDLEKLKLPFENPILKIATLLETYDLNKIVQKVLKEGTSYKTIVPKSVDINKLTQTNENKKITFEPILLDNRKALFDTIAQIAKNSIVAFDTETTGLDTKNAQIVGFSFCFENNKAYYVPIGHFYLGVGDQVSFEDAKKAIEYLNKYKIVCQNFKYDYEIVKQNFQIELKLYADTMIMAWLLHSHKPVGLDKLALQYFNYTMIPFKDMVKKGENFSNVNLQDACKYASEDAWITKKLFDKFIEIFKQDSYTEILNEAFNVEFPFVYVLGYMQSNGIKVDINKLELLKEKNKLTLDKLTKEIYDLSGTVFNINSPKQLGDVLFGTLQLPHGKKTKTGYSTNESVLLKLKDEHKVVEKLLEYREAFKLQSTYIEPLIELANNDLDHKIYTSFIQTGTSTGRLSSKNPNLQNIPVRTNEGRQIRGAFIARDGYKLVGIDYSQIELRLLAHFSCDPALLEAFRKGGDIHYQTAVAIFSQEKAKEKRHIAKTINFGLIYGMGAKKLAQTLDITPKEAKQYIQSYFDKFATVKEYLKSIEDFALENGYVKTLLNRKRFFDFSTATPMLKAGYLREAVNTVFQGSASDLIKLSQNKIYDKYKNNDDIKMLLQIHDELIFEIRNDKVDTIVSDLKNIMTTIFLLEVPLDVSVAIGDNWGDLK